MTKRGAFDFECWEWVNPRACGFLWGPANAREWECAIDKKSTNPERLACDALEMLARIAKEDGICEWWAHNGGRYDVAFILRAIQLLGWEATGHVAGGRLVVLHVTAKDGTKLVIYDSMALVPSSLKKAAESFNLKSRKLFGEDDYAIDVRKWPLKRLEDGCRADCECVLELLEAVEPLLEEQGGKLKATFSSSALSVLEAKVHLPDTRRWISENQQSRAAYLGGRVEVLHHNPGENLCELDVSSSYPWAMSQRLPFRLIGAIGATKCESMLYSHEHEGCIEATVTVPSMWLPPLPMRSEEGGVFFPVGTWRGSFQTRELRYAVECGARVKKFHGGVCYKAAKPFDAVIASLYEIKKNATGAKREFAKLLLNGSYGKFGQKPERENLRIFPTKAAAMEFALGAPSNTVRFLSDNDERFLGVAVERWAKRTHFALAGAVTANSRVLLHQFLSKAIRPAYCDTDSVHAATESLKTLAPFGNELGQLKVEIEAMRANYYAPKIYELIPIGTGKVHFASKGFPVGADAFRKVVNGEKVETERMRLAKTQLRAGGIPARVKTHRAWTGRSMKRKPFPDGSTAPWNAEEIARGIHLKAMSPLFKK